MERQSQLTEEEKVFFMQEAIAEAKRQKRSQRFLLVPL